jgi:hypothetical protein
LLRLAVRAAKRAAELDNAQPWISRWPPTEATKLLWLIEHLAYADRLWIMHRFVGGEKPVPITTG